MTQPTIHSLIRLLSFSQTHAYTHAKNSLFTAESQHRLYHHLSQALFCGEDPVGEVTLLLECVDCVGAPFHGATRVRHVVRGGGAYVACALSITPLSSPTAMPPDLAASARSLLFAEKPARRRRRPARQPKQLADTQHAGIAFNPQSLFLTAPMKPERLGAPFIAPLFNSSMSSSDGGGGGAAPLPSGGQDRAGEVRACTPSVRAREGIDVEEGKETEEEGGSVSSASSCKKRWRCTPSLSMAAGEPAVRGAPIEMPSFPYMQRYVRLTAAACDVCRANPLTYTETHTHKFRKPILYVGSPPAGPRAAHRRRSPARGRRPTRRRRRRGRGSSTRPHSFRSPSSSPRNGPTSPTAARGSPRCSRRAP